MTFWDHLDVLRASLLRVAAATLLGAVALFCCRSQLFDAVLAPSRADFCVYRLMGADVTSVTLINTELTRQFAAHIHMSIYVAFALVFPYALYEVFACVAPGLYDRERRYVRAVMLGGTVMFYAGMALSYFMVFPFSLRFLATYQVSADIPNVITLDSYLSTLLSLTLMLGLVFELPVALWLAGKMGVVHRQMLVRYRRHVVVALLVVAAIITPTTDALTLVLVSLPLFLLYELGICLVPRR